MSRQSNGRLLGVRGVDSLGAEGLAGLAMFAGRMSFSGVPAPYSPSAAAVAGAVAGAAGKGGQNTVSGRQLAATAATHTYTQPQPSSNEAREAREALGQRIPRQQSTAHQQKAMKRT